MVKSLTVCSWFPDKLKGQPKIENSATALSWYLHSHKRTSLDKDQETFFGQDEDVSERFISSLKKMLKTPEPKLIAMIGHGNPIGFAVNPNERITNERLATLLRNAKAPTLVIADYCHSFALANECREQAVNKKLVGIIAACPADAQCYLGSLTPSILQYWKCWQTFPGRLLSLVPEKPELLGSEWAVELPSSGKRVRAKTRRIRWGARHDHLFLPKKISEADMRELMKLVERRR